MAKKKFEPMQHYKTDRKGNYVLDDKNCKIPLDLYRGTTFEEMISYLKDSGTEEEKKEFKEVCHKKKVYVEKVGKKGGKKKVPTGETVYSEDINVLYAKEWFFNKFAKEYLPKKKEVDEKVKMQQLLDEL